MQSTGGTKTVHGNDYGTHGADLAKVIQALHLKDVAIVGWSFGALQAWGYVKQAGIKNLKAMVYIDLSPKPLSLDPEAWVEGSLDEIGAIYNTYMTSPQGQRDFVTAYATGVMVQRQLIPEELCWFLASIRDA